MFFGKMNQIRMIENRLRIERQVFMGRQETKRSQEPTIPNPQGAAVSGSGGGGTEGSQDEMGGISGVENERSQVYGTDSELEMPQMGSPEGSLRQLRMLRDRRNLHRRLSQSSKSVGLFLDQLVGDETGGGNSSAGEEIVARRIFRHRHSSSSVRSARLANHSDGSDERDRNESTAEELLIED
jgi:hypothetical protein